jgi:hypothetical protein
VTLLFYAKNVTWHGGWAGGPRYLLPTLPFLIMVIAPTLEAIHGQIGSSEHRRFWAVQRASVVLLLAAGFIIQAVTLTYPRDRYYADSVFYAHRPLKPWWYGSIPLAAFDYWSQTSIPKREANYSEPDRNRTETPADSDPLWYQKHADAAATENQFVNSFQNPENLTLPELMVLKRRLMGWPAKAIYGYLIAVLVIILTGAVGLKRYAGFQESPSSAPLKGQRIAARSGQL